MARPREFDEAVALDAAMDCFWREGYEATSVRDLAARMGITGTSLYNAFGDKRSLFRQALQRYAERSTRERIARLESTLPPKQAIRAFLGEIVERSLDDRDRRGCLLVNSALEIAPHDPEVAAEVAARLGEIEVFFRRAVTAAQADGSVPPDRDAGDLARLLLGVTLGVRVLARSNPQRELLEGTVRPALALLDWPPRTERRAPSDRQFESNWSEEDEMTRLTDLPPAMATRLAELECPDFATRPWVSGPALSRRRVAIVSSAGLVVRGANPFRGRDPDYRAIPADTKPEELLISHISINFDRTGFQEDWNVVFPLDRLNELAADGVIGSVAEAHYSFMGATDPIQMEPHARELAGRLERDNVDAVILSPV